MNILAIDTSTKACVLGLQKGEQVFRDETVLDRTHSKEILPRVAALLEAGDLKRDQIDLIVYGQGPGSFTGLRIGVGVVQGLAYGLGKPVVGVSSLACLAQKQFRLSGHQHALVALTARHTEVYFGAYEVIGEHAQLIGHEGVFEAEEIPTQNPNPTWVGVGGGWSLVDLLRRGSGVEVAQVYLEDYPEAVDLLALGQHGFDSGQAKTAAEALPEYLREQVAAKPA